MSVREGQRKASVNWVHVRNAQGECFNLRESQAATSRETRLELERLSASESQKTLENNELKVAHLCFLQGRVKNTSCPLVNQRTCSLCRKDCRQCRKLWQNGKMKYPR